MKKIFLSILSLFLLDNVSVFGQEKCTTTIVQEAVRNGDFEKGYIKGDFNSDQVYAQDAIDEKLKVGICHYATGDKYYISDFQQVYECYSGYTDPNATIGTSFSPDWKLIGLKGQKDKILYIDPKAIVGAVLWEQDVTIIPNQTYYFSFWSTLVFSPNVQYKVFVGNEELILSQNITKDIPAISYLTDGKGKPIPDPNNPGDFLTKPLITYKFVLDSLGNRIPDPNNPGSFLITSSEKIITWTQHQAIWKSSNQTAVKLTIKAYGSGGLKGDTIVQNGADIAIDNISLINSSENFYNGLVNELPNFGADTISLCLNKGSVELNSGITEGNFYWFEGNENTQKLIQHTKNTYITTQAGRYRVCVEKDGKTTNATIVVSDKLPLSKLPNFVNLCSPSKITLDDGFVQDGLVHNWTGTTTANTQTILIDKAGEYTKTVSFPSMSSCITTKNVSVFSSLPIAPTNLEYCKGGGTLTQLIGIDASKQWRWFEDIQATKVIGTGKIVDWTPKIGTIGNQTLYLQNAETTPVGMVGPTLLNSYTGKGVSTNFTTKQRIVIESVDVNATTWYDGCQGTGSTSNFIVTIPELGLSKTVIIQCGKTQTINLNFEIPAGSYTLKINANSTFLFSKVINSSIQNIIDITSAETVFANWKILRSAACDVVPVNVKEKECPILNTFTNQHATVWIFGEGIQVDFATGQPIASKGGFSNGIAGMEGEGFASFSNAQGKLLFFTDGNRVLNADRTVMTNGTKLNGDLSSTQSATILPKIGRTNEYYIFTTGVYGSKKGIQYSVVKYDNATNKGEVITKNVPLITNQYMMEALTIVPHSNGTDSWVIAHGAGGSDKYYAYQVSATGISEAVISSIGLFVPLKDTLSQIDANDIGIIKSNSCYTQIAMANLSLKKVEVLAFDNATGKVGNVYATIDGFSGFLYGIEFSPNGKYIYTSEYNTKKLAQFDISGVGNITNTKVDLGTGIDNRLGQLQQGPDGKIYIAGHGWGSGKTHLGVINSPNEKGTASNVNFNLIEFDFSNNFQTCTMGLPQFAKQYIAQTQDQTTCSSITSSLNFQEQQTTIYPNPFTNTITIKSVSSTIEKIQLVDVYGNVVEEVFNPSETIEMGQTLSSGTYFIQLHSAQNVTTQKVIKIN